MNTQTVLATNAQTNTDPSLSRQWITLRRVGTGICVFAVVSAVCWSLRGHRLEGGDTEQFLQPVWTEAFLTSPGWTFFFREPLSFLAPQIVHRLTAARGWPLEDVYALPSCLAGGAFAVVLLGFSRRLVFWAIMLGNTTVFLFLGHIENYALAFVAETVALMVGWRLATGRGRRLWPVVGCWCLAMAFHQMAAFLAPAGLALLVRREGGRWRLIRHSRRDATASLLLITALCLFYVVPTVLSAFEITPVIVYGTTGSIWEFLTPVSQSHAAWVEERSVLGSWSRYTLFTPAHWRQMAIFQIALCPLGLVSLIVMLRRRRGRGQVFLALACAAMLLWSLFWHPHMGWNDWDLWSLMAAPMNLTAALLWSGGLRTAPCPRQIGAVGADSP